MIFCIEYVSVLTFGILLLLPSIMHVLTSLLRLHQWIRSSIVKLTNKEDFVFICLLQLANVSLSLALYAMYIHINYFSQTLVNHFRSSHWMELALVFRSILEHGMVSLTPKMALSKQCFYILDVIPSMGRGSTAHPYI